MIPLNDSWNYLLHTRSGQRVPVILMILVYPNSTAKAPTFFSIVYGIELFFLLVSMATLWFFMYAIVNAVSRYHYNLRAIILVFISFYYIGIGSRIVMIAYQFGFFEKTEVLEEDIPLLVFSYLRMLTLLLATNYVPAITLERALATKYIADYEKKERKWVSAAVLLFVILWNALDALYVTFGFMHNFFLIYLLVRQSLFTILYLFIYQYNRKTHKRLGDFTTNLNGKIENYTLSLRFQLAENIRVMKHLKYLALTFFPMFVIGVGTLVMSFILNDYDSIQGQMWIAVFEMFIAIAANILTTHLFLLNQGWMEMIYMLCPLGHKLSGIAPLETEAERERRIHFEQLHIWWNK